MAIHGHFSSRTLETQVISSENLDPSALDFVLTALWSWAANHPGHTFQDFKAAYLRAVVLSGKGGAS